MMDEFDDFKWYCEICDGDVDLLGVLGNREIGRCRNCGMQHDREVEND